MSKFVGPQTAALICQVRAIAEYVTDPENRSVILAPLAGELFVAGQEVLDEDERRQNEWKKLVPNADIGIPTTDEGFGLLGNLIAPPSTNDDGDAA